MKKNSFLLCVLVLLLLTGCEKEPAIAAKEDKNNLYITVNCELEKGVLINSITVKTEDGTVVPVDVDIDEFSQPILIPEAFAIEDRIYIIEIVDNYDSKYIEKVETSSPEDHVSVKITKDDIVEQSKLSWFEQWFNSHK